MYTCIRQSNHYDRSIFFPRKDCIAGHHAVMDNIGSLVHCVPCPFDTYQTSETRSPVCSNCPIGSTTNNVLGSVEPEECSKFILSVEC